MTTSRKLHTWAVTGFVGALLSVSMSADAGALLQRSPKAAPLPSTPAATAAAMGRTAQPSAAQVGARSESAVGEWQGRTREASVRGLVRWIYSMPLGVSGLLDGTDAHCGVNQDGPLWYLIAPLGDDVQRSCTMPAGRAILAPLVMSTADYPCPVPGFEPAAGQSLDDFLLGTIAEGIDSFHTVSATLNGRPLKVRRITTRSFAFVGAADWSAADICVTGAAQPVLADGWYVAIDPLPPGDHELRLQSSSSIPEPWVGNSMTTFKLKVR